MEEKTKRKIEEIIREERGDADRKYPLFSSLHEGESVIREEIEEVSEVLDEIMETHNWIWKAVRANKSETVKSAAKTIARLSRELITESVQVAAVAGKIVDSIDGSQKRGSHCESCVIDYDECLRKVAHEIKILPAYFNAVKCGAKRFELRKNDRGYESGDTVIMREWNGSEYTGEKIIITITYVLKDCPEYGLMNGYCILGW